MCGEVIAQYLFQHLLQRKLWMCTSISHDESSIIAKKVIMSKRVASSFVNLGTTERGPGAADVIPQFHVFIIFFLSRGKNSTRWGRLNKLNCAF